MHHYDSEGRQRAQSVDVVVSFSFINTGGVNLSDCCWMSILVLLFLIVVRVLSVLSCCPGQAANPLSACFGPCVWARPAVFAAVFPSRCGFMRRRDVPLGRSRFGRSRPGFLFKGDASGKRVASRKHRKAGHGRPEGLKESLSRRPRRRLPGRGLSCSRPCGGSASSRASRKP